ncbi:MAG: hypothetical protein IKF14_00330 [Atopobiaceae bacterium]|nr:hypothetical protein [Atopobiaceae bacterium]
MPSEAQKRADRKYKHDKTRQLCLRFYPAEDDMWLFLSAQENKQGFLKGLISRAMESGLNSSEASFRPVETRRSEHISTQRGTMADGSAYNDGLEKVGKADS